MNKSFIIENVVKTALTAFVLLACWAMLSPTFAAEDAQQDRQARMQERMENHMENHAERMERMDKDLSADQVRDIVQGRIASMGESNLKVGGVTESGNDTVLVDIVTKDDSLVQTVEISTRTGRPANMDRRFSREGRRSELRGPGQDDDDSRRVRDHKGPRGQFARGQRGGDFSSLALAMGPRNGDLGLTVAQARTLAESRLILSGNDRLKVGSVEALDDDTIIVEILTVDDSLVVRRSIDRDNGRMTRVR